MVAREDVGLVWGGLLGEGEGIRVTVIPQTTTLECTVTTHCCSQSSYHNRNTPHTIHDRLCILSLSYPHKPSICPGGMSPYLYGIRGKSCYTVFVEDKQDGTYGCRYERCRDFLTYSLDDAIRHQRSHHFDHRPFVSIPRISGDCGKCKRFSPLSFLSPIRIQDAMFTHTFLAAIKRFHAQDDLQNHQQHCW